MSVAIDQTGEAVRKDEVVGRNIEGWTWLTNSKKWHYFSEQRSLCRKFALLRHPSEGYEHGADDSPDNCAACRKRLASFTRRDPND